MQTTATTATPTETSSTHLSSGKSDSKVSQIYNQTLSLMTMWSASHKQQQQQTQQQQQLQGNMVNLTDAEMICKKNNNKTSKYNNNGNMLCCCRATGMSRCHCQHKVTACCKPHRRAGVNKNVHHHCNNNNNNNNTKKTKKKKKNKKNSNKKLPHWIYIIALLICTLGDVTQAALRNVNLLIEPPAVRRGQTVRLRCDYSLDAAPLYSIKFYRGNMEFYRYTPGEYPNTKVFQYPGIKVDESSSNATQVIIRNVSFGLTGNFSCEVTADAPLYSTAVAFAQVQVVEFPEKRPQLFTEHTRYEPGDVLRANCSTPPSRPRAELRFTINGIPVTSEETQYIRTVDNLIASRLSLKLQLQAVHFTAAVGTNAHMMNTLGNSLGGTSANGYPGGAVGGLLLRCTAQIGDLYQEYKEIELGTPQKDPVPARVTLSSGSSLKNFFETYFMRSSANRLFNNKNFGLQWIIIKLLSLSCIAYAINSFHCQTASR